MDKSPVEKAKVRSPNASPNSTKAQAFVGAIMPRLATLLDGDNPGSPLNDWRVKKRNELALISIVGGYIVIGVMCFMIDGDPKIKPVVELACWGTAVFMAVASIAIAFHEHRASQRISCMDDGFKNLPLLVRGGGNNLSSEKRESFLRHYLWRTPIILLNISVCFFVPSVLGDQIFRNQELSTPFACLVAVHVLHYLVRLWDMYVKIVEVERALKAVKIAV